MPEIKRAVQHNNWLFSKLSTFGGTTEEFCISQNTAMTFSSCGGQIRNHLSNFVGIL